MYLQDRGPVVLSCSLQIPILLELIFNFIVMVDYWHAYLELLFADVMTYSKVAIIEKYFLLLFQRSQ